MKHSKEIFIFHPNTSKSVKKNSTALRFSTLFSVFGNPVETLFLVFDLLHKAGLHSDISISISSVNRE